MKRSMLCAAICLLVAGTVSAQDAPPKVKAPKAAKAAKAAKADGATKKKKSEADTIAKPEKLPNAPLFKSLEPLEVTLTTNLKSLRKDRGDKAPYHFATLTYADKDAAAGTRVVPLRVRTRGIWRLKNCVFPPIRLNFANKETKGSIFHDLDEPKLVSHCRIPSVYEDYVLLEFQLYRIYRLLTPVSHRVRLLRMTYTDSATGKVDATKYAFISEDPAHVAAVNGGALVKLQGATPEDLDGEQTTLAYLFQYMIGNTDFSFSGLHNAELLSMPSGAYLPIAYDFDFSGAINAPYATPDPSLRIARVRDRLYRGYCSQNALVPKMLEKFQTHKAAIYALYSDPIGALISPGAVKSTLAYFDEFYETISNPKAVQNQILRDCLLAN